MATSTRGMIFLEPGNRMVADILNKRFEAVDEGEKLDPLTETLCDFDQVRFQLVADKATPNIISVSLSQPAFAELATCGLPEILEEYFGPLMTEPRDGMDVTLEFDVTAPPMEPAELVDRVSKLKRVVVGAPFTRAFRALVAGTSGDVPAAHIHHHRNESLFVIPRADRVTIVYAVEFEDITDRAMARVIAQEFVEAQRRTNGAPSVQLTKDPPLELSGLALPVTDSFVGYLSFGVFAKHVNSPDKLERAVDLMSGFRNYIHYHIKAAKSFLHTRMRLRVESMLDILNRAKGEVKDKEKKLMDGRTFTRKV